MSIPRFGPLCLSSLTQHCNCSLQREQRWTRLSNGFLPINKNWRRQLTSGNLFCALIPRYYISRRLIALDSTSCTFNNFQFDEADNALTSHSTCLSIVKSADDSLHRVVKVLSAMQGQLEEHASVQAIFTALRQELVSIDKEMRQVKLARGLASLPDDILGLIFESSLESSSRGAWYNGTFEDLLGSTTAFRMAAVCKRFRAIALTTPRIWRYASLATGDLDVIQLCRERSKDFGLSFRFEPLDYIRAKGRTDMSIIDICQVVKKAFADAHSLSMSLVTFHDPERQDYLDTLEHNVDFDFPRLQKVMIEGSPRDTFLRHVLSRLSITAYQLMDLGLCIRIGSSRENSFEGIILPQQISDLDLTINMSNPLVYFSLQLSDVSVLLSQPSHLTSLNFTFGSELSISGLEQTTVPVLPHLRSLAINLHGTAARSFASPLFLGRLYFPTIERLHLHALDEFKRLQRNDCVEYTVWDLMFREDRSYPSLKDLRINHGAKNSLYSLPGFLDAPLQCCPWLEYLEVTNLAVGTFSVFPPRLQTVIFSDCRMVHDDCHDVLEIIGGLKKATDLQHFQMRNCSSQADDRFRTESQTFCQCSFEPDWRGFVLECPDGTFICPSFKSLRSESSKCIFSRARRNNFL